MLRVTSLAERRASAAPLGPPLRHTVRRTSKGMSMVLKRMIGLLQRSGQVNDWGLPSGMLGIAIVVLFMVPVQAATWHVPSECPTIHAGLDSASSGDTVLVAPGIYPVTADRETWNRVPAGVCLTSESGPEATIVEICGDTYECIYVVSGAEGVRVSGFTMRMGSGPRCRIPENCGVSCCQSTDLIVENCIMEDLDRGIYVIGRSSEWWWPLFRDNIIRRCKYGILCEEVYDPGRPYFLRNTVTQSTYAGAMVWNSSPMFDSNEFSGGYYGMYFEGWCGGGCRLNSICSNTQHGVVIYPDPELAAPGFNGGLDPNYANDFSGNGGYAIYNGFEHPTTGIFAEFNYWGSRCPNFSELFHGPVTYEPWVDSTHTEILNHDDCPDATEPTTWGAIKAMFGDD